MCHLVHVLHLGLELILKTRLQDVDAAENLELVGLGPQRLLGSQRSVGEGGDRGECVRRRITLKDETRDGPASDAARAWFRDVS